MTNNRVSTIWGSIVGLIIVFAVPGYAQQATTIDARVSGGGGSGKCTFEVAVQGSAEVQIRGSQGRLVTLSGSPAQWRRLDCNQPLPANPTDFHFKGIDGHGKQKLLVAPNSNDGVAVIRIDNNGDGNEGYTGDILWNGSSNRGTNWGNPSSNWNDGWNSNAGFWGNGSSSWGGQFRTIRAKVSRSGGSGKCTFEVVVNGVADVEIRGDQGRLRTISGNPATWRRLDCNQPLPANPNSFKFSGVDGHGKQSLVEYPGSNHGVAVIRIDNGNRGNNEGYTGDITWKGASGYSNAWGNNSGYQQSALQWTDTTGWNGGASNSTAAQVCQSFIARRVGSEHSDVTNVQMLPNTTQVLQDNSGVVRVQGEGQYQSNSGGSGGFRYRCAYDTRTQQVAESGYRQ